MDPCPFFRVRVGNLALKLPSEPTSSGTRLTTLHHNPTTLAVASVSNLSPLYYCKIKFANFPVQTVTVPVALPDAASGATVSSPGTGAAACFSLLKSELDKLVALEKKKKNKNWQAQRELSLKIDLYATKGGTAVGCSGFGASPKFMGRVCVALADLGQDRPALIHSGWVNLGTGEGKKSVGVRDGGSQLYVSVKGDPDPRFVFEFDGEPECSPQVFQVQGNIKQPVFSCKFGFRNSGDWSNRSSSIASEPSVSTSCWRTPLRDNSSRNKGHDHHNNHLKNERKGWTVTIHDLSGSPIAAASMVTPFVPSQGSDRVSRSNPGAWLILRPGDGTWKPWGRLEVWRDRSPSGSDSIGHRFEIIPDSTPPNVNIPSPVGSSSSGVTLSNGSDISAKKGGKLTIDIGSYNSPITSPNSSFDLGSWNGSGSAGSAASGSDCGGLLWWPQFMYRGFVMSSTIGGEKEIGKGPEVEVGVQHVACAEDAAVFVALAAAMDLSVDACLPFSKKLRKELRQQQRSGSGEVVF